MRLSRFVTMLYILLILGSVVFSVFYMMEAEEGSTVLFVLLLVILNLIGMKMVASKMFAYTSSLHRKGPRARLLRKKKDTEEDDEEEEDEEEDDENDEE